MTNNTRKLKLSRELTSKKVNSTITEEVVNSPSDEEVEKVDEMDLYVNLRGTNN